MKDKLRKVKNHIEEFYISNKDNVYGYYKYFHGNKSIYSEGKYYNNQLIGLWKYFNNDKGIRMVKTYKNYRYNGLKILFFYETTTNKNN